MRSKLIFAINIILYLSYLSVYAGDVSDIVRHFFESHRTRNIEGIEASFAAGAKLYLAGRTEPLLDGRKAFGDFFRTRFQTQPDDKTQVENLYEIGPFVIVKEKVERPSKPPSEVLDIFHVTDAVIRSVWVFDPEDDNDSAPEIVEQQVQSYNEKNLNQFLSFYNTDAVLYDLKTGNILAAGRTAMEKRYSERFNTSPQLHATILHRVSAGNYVIDYESVVMGTSNETVQAIVIYSVKEKLIHEVWFLTL